MTAVKRPNLFSMAVDEAKRFVNVIETDDSMKRHSAER